MPAVLPLVFSHPDEYADQWVCLIGVTSSLGAGVNAKIVP